MSSDTQPVLSWGGSSCHTELMLLSCPAQRPGVCWVPKGLEVSSPYFPWCWFCVPQRLLVNSTNHGQKLKTKKRGEGWGEGRKCEETRHTCSSPCCIFSLCVPPTVSCRRKIVLSVTMLDSWPHHNLELAFSCRWWELKNSSCRHDCCSPMNQNTQGTEQHIKLATEIYHCTFI